MEAVTALAVLAALVVVWAAFRPRGWTVTPDSWEFHRRRDEVVSFLVEHRLDPNDVYQIDFAESWSRVWRFHNDEAGRKHLASEHGGPADEVCRIAPVVVPATLAVT